MRQNTQPHNVNVLGAGPAGVVAAIPAGRDGGHGMLFRDFDARLWMTLHHPNDTPNERPMWLEVTEDLDRLALERED